MWNMHDSYLLLLPLGIALATAVGAAPSVDRTGSLINIMNGSMRLVIDTTTGINPRLLRTQESGIVYADTDYCWPGGKAPALSGKPAVRTAKDGSKSVVLKGVLGDLAIEQRFSAPAGRPGAITERITIRNKSGNQIDTASFRCGFAKRLKSDGNWLPEAEKTLVCGIPYRRETDGSMREYPLRHIMENKTTYGAWAVPLEETSTWGSEGWVLSDGKQSLLVAKYNPEHMEWSLISPADSGSVACIGGAGHWKEKLPPTHTTLAPGKSLAFGETLYQAVDGDWKQAYYAYRGYMESNKCGLRKGFNPPVQWNELYENAYFGAICGALGSATLNDEFWNSQSYKDTEQRLLRELYTLDDMKEQARKASELGCEALYLDPGWDVTGCSHIWGEDRLGTLDSFIKTMKDEYNLKVCVWISLAGVPPTIINPFLYPGDSWVLDKDGRPIQPLQLYCWMADSFQEAKIRALKTLAEKGIAFMLFDATQYTGPCYDTKHGHSIPSTREEHAKAMLKLTQAVHKTNPKTIVEWHDPITGPCNIHYTPTYYLYNKPNSFDCIWGHEFMWDSMGDLTSGRAVSLYYYNLAYSIPMYLHIGLKSDNANALVFWWYASTIRDLGIGGQHPDPKVWEAHKQAMKTYMAHKQFFTQGAFYGLGEEVHAHTLASKKTSVMNVFNLTDAEQDKEIIFGASEIGLPAGHVLAVDGADECNSREDRARVRVKVPAKGHRLLIVSAVKVP